MNHPYVRRAPALLALACVPLGASCLTLDAFVFNNEAADPYGWDDDPCDPQLEGEIALAREAAGGPPASCHPSRVPPENRIEGFVDVDGMQIHYVYAHNPGSATTIFYSHGNRRHLGYYWDRVELMWSWGYNVLVYDYPGYGLSEGDPDEPGVYNSAAAALGLLSDLPDVDPDRVFFVGYSLGGAPTYELALRAEQGNLPLAPRGVLTEAAWCNFDTLVGESSYIGLPRRALLDQEFDNCRKVAALDPELPVTLLHGTADDTVIYLNAKQLRDAAAPAVELFAVPGGEHSNLPVAAEADYEAWFIAFLGADARAQNR